MSDRRPPDSLAPEPHRQSNGAQSNSQSCNELDDVHIVLLPTMQPSQRQFSVSADPEITSDNATD